VTGKRERFTHTHLLDDDPHALLTKLDADKWEPLDYSHTLFRSLDMDTLQKLADHMDLFLPPTECKSNQGLLKRIQEALPAFLEEEWTASKDTVGSSGPFLVRTLMFNGLNTLSPAISNTLGWNYSQTPVLCLLRGLLIPANWDFLARDTLETWMHKHAIPAPKNKSLMSLSQLKEYYEPLYASKQDDLLVALGQGGYFQELVHAQAFDECYVSLLISNGDKRADFLESVNKLRRHKESFCPSATLCEWEQDVVQWAHETDRTVYPDQIPHYKLLAHTLHEWVANLIHNAQPRVANLIANTQPLLTQSQLEEFTFLWTGPKEWLPSLFVHLKNPKGLLLETHTWVGRSWKEEADEEEEDARDL
jgi:hypothetical protein